MKKFMVSLFLFTCLASALVAEPRERKPRPDVKIFATIEEVRADAAQRLAALSSQQKIFTAVNNSFNYEGDVALVLFDGLSPQSGALLLDYEGIRFECDTDISQAGCTQVQFGDHVLIYGHLRSYFSCRHGYTDTEARIDFMYKKISFACNGRLCTSWVMISS